MLVDTNFGVGAQALAVMAYFNTYEGILSSWKDTHYCAQVNAAPWYNGRERGIVFYMQDRAFQQQLNIAVFEHRNSDSICAVRWEGNTFNPPTLADIPAGVYENKWDTAHDVEYGNAPAMARWVYDEFDNFWRACSTNTVDTAVA